MALKASILLLLIATSVNEGYAGASFEAELRDATLKNDWTAQVSLLSPRKGQNFEQDLQLGKALLQLERRIDSLKVLVPLHQGSRDERVARLIRLASEMFFNQETSNLFFEALRLLSVGKYGDARDRLEQANSKESGNLMVIQRLIQVDILTGAYDSAGSRLKEALSLAPLSAEAKAFAMKLALVADDQNRGEVPRSLMLPKKPYPASQVPFVFTLEALKRWGKVEEIRVIAANLVREHPKWIFAMVWLYSSGMLPDPVKGRLKMQIDRELKNRDRFEKELDLEMRETQHYWVGYISYEDLVKNSR
jgi:tetratricopeptide (TPR) repeat protein